MHRVVWTLILVLTMLISLIGCSSDVSGGGTDTSNSIIMGNILNSDFISVDGAIVKILPVDYNPVKDSTKGILFTDTCKAGGIFRFDIELEGLYNIYAHNPKDSQNTIIKSVLISENDSFNFQDMVIKDHGTIKMVPTDYASFNPNYFYIPGTEVFASMDSLGNALLHRVPAEESFSVFINTDFEDVAIIDSIFVSSNSITTTPLNVLILIGGDSSVALTDRVKEQRQMMIDSGANVSVGNFNEFSTSNFDTSKIDLIYCAYNVDWSSLKADEFVTLPKNLALVSGEGYAKLGMIADSAGVTYGTATEYNIMTGVNGEHPVLSGTGTSSSATTHAFEGGAASWGKVENSNTAGILIGVADQKRKYIFVYHKGADMEVGVAPASRIALFSGDVDLGDNRGRMILWRTMLWGSGKL